MKQRHLDFILQTSRNQHRSENSLNYVEVYQKGEFSICKSFNGPDFKKQEIKQVEEWTLGTSNSEGFGKFDHLIRKS